MSDIKDTLEMLDSPEKMREEWEKIKGAFDARLNKKPKTTGQMLKELRDMAESN
jgi:hypothetical protein|tara:strand:+ start:223 stop:384 length:162 start_codon:yes stop_codon:yes gene_type:complete